LNLGHHHLLARCSTSPFVLGIFEIGSLKLFDLGWIRTTIFMISASWVARITGVSHRCPACSDYFRDGVSWTICLGWPWILILLISASSG
jgi:hypothetical protein